MTPAYSKSQKWCKHWCKRLAALNAEVVGSGRLGGLAWLAIEWQRRQRVEGACDVQQFRIGIHAHCQPNVTVPHGGLRCSRGHATSR
jgi:hypothetical protein